MMHQQTKRTELSRTRHFFAKVGGALLRVLFLPYLMLLKAFRSRCEKEIDVEELRAKFAQHAANARTICILTPRFPLPENGGDVLRINNIARQLKGQGYRLVLVSLDDDDEPQMYEAMKLYDKVYCVHRNRLYSLFMSGWFLVTGRPMQCGYYHSRRYMKLLKSVIAAESPDLYIAHLLRMMPYLDHLGLQERSIIEMTDALSKTYALSTDESRGNFLLRYIYQIECGLIQQYEKRAIAHYPKNVLVSQSDIDYLKTLVGNASMLELHSNGIAERPYVARPYDVRKIVFVGNMRTLQNQDAVLTFVHDIFPYILEQIPDVVLYIVGAQPPKGIQQHASANINVTGFVEDIGSVISDACLAIAPVRLAAGIQNKVLISMSCGVPVVLTSLVAEGIPELRHDENCLISNDSRDFAENCMRIMRDAELRSRLSKAACEMVKEKYSWRSKIQGYVN